MKKRTPFAIALTIGLWVGLTSFTAVAMPSPPNKEEAIQYFEDYRYQMQDDSQIAPEEKEARTDFVDRLIFFLDSKYKGDNMKTFLSQTIDHMIEIDSQSANRLGYDDRDFLKELALAMKEDLEPNENPMKFVIGFMEFTGMTVSADKSDVNSPDQFGSRRAYTNGAEWEEAKGLSLEEAGDYAAQLVPEYNNNLQNNDNRDDSL